MQRAKRALVGYNKTRPPRPRAPIAKEIVGGSVSILHQSAVMTMVMFATVRPGEMRSLKAKQVLKPVRSTGTVLHWGLADSPQEESEASW